VIEIWQCGRHLRIQVGTNFNIFYKLDVVINDYNCARDKPLITLNRDQLPICVIEQSIKS